MSLQLFGSFRYTAHTYSRRVCIARLYGGGPSLHLSPELIPSASQPLTPAFSLSSKPSTSSSSSPVPAGHQAATPRFLLSLLATATFLGMPAAAAHALQLILASVGPFTAVRYLNFAIGKGIGPSEEEEASEDKAAVGLESVAEVVPDESDEPEIIEHPSPKYAHPDPAKQQEKDTETIGGKLSSLSTDDPPLSPGFKKETPASPRSDASSMELESTSSLASPTTMHAQRLEPSYCYGVVGDKVGEAAACWIARWGADILACELEVVARKKGEEGAAGARGPAIRWQGLGDEKESKEGKEKEMGRKRGLTAPSRLAPPEGVGKAGGRAGSAAEQEGGERVVPVVWRRGGLSARWVRGLISSDALFVRGERERYDMAKAVVELRRSAPLEDQEDREAEEKEWEELFRTGIYYENMVSCL